MTIREALEKANNQLMAKIDNAMTNEVFKEVEDEEIATIEEVVYNVYTPKIYRRRGANGGLAWRDNIIMRGGKASNGVLVVENVTDPNDGDVRDQHRVTTDKNLPELIEYGHGYKGYTYDFADRKYPYLKPRPFTAKTIEHLKDSGAHINALKAGLRRQNVKVK